MFNGYKTYLVSLVFIATGLEMYFVGGATIAEAGLYVLNGLGLGAIRHGIKSDSTAV